MEPTTALPLTDDELHAVVDGQAAPDQITELKARLLADAAGQEKLAQWQAQRQALRSLHQEVLHEQVPPSLQQATQQTLRAHETSGQWRRQVGMAASLLLTFGAGWFANAQWDAAAPSTANHVLVARAQLERDFVRQASVAHSVYVPEVRHPVEVTALEQAHLVQWLSKRLGKPLKVPVLAAQGFELVGGRLLPGDSGARAQFMFQSGAGTRITLYIGAVAASDPALAKDTSFKFETNAGVPSFYWVDQGFGYALAGQVPREQLMALSQLVYQQL